MRNLSSICFSLLAVLTLREPVSAAIVTDTTSGTESLPGTTGDVVNYNVVTGAGIWTLDGSKSRDSLGETNSAQLTVDLGSGGVLTLTSSGADTTAGLTQAALLKTGTGLFTINPNITIANNVTFAVTNTTNSITLNGAIGQDVAGRTVTKIGTGTVIYGGSGAAPANTHTGLTTVNDGTFQLSRFTVTPAGTPAAGTGTITSNLAIAGNLTIGDGVGAANSANVQTAIAIISANGPVGNQVNQIADTAAVTINSDGRLRLFNGSETIASLTMAGGSVDIGGANSNPNSFQVTGATTLSGGASLQGSGGNHRFRFDGNISTSGASTVLVGTSSNPSFDFGGGNRTITVADGATAVDFQFGSGGNTGLVNFRNGSATKAGNGLMEVRSGNFGAGAGFTGWTIETGTMRLASTLVLGAATVEAQVTTVNGGILDIQTFNQFSRGGVVLTGGTITGTTGTITVASGNSFDVRNGAVSAILAGSGAKLDKTTSGTVILSGTNTYTGGTAVNLGVLTYLNTGAKPTPGTTTVAAGATLGLGVASSGSFFTAANVDSLFAGTLANVTNNATSNVGIDTSAGDFVYATSVPSTTRGLTKLGAGTLTLSGASSYTGATTVSAGTLGISGSISGTVSVSLTGGTLSLSANNVTDAGNVSSTVTTGKASVAMAGGTLKIADSVSNLSETFGVLTLSTTSTLDFGTGFNNRFNFESLSISGGVLNILNWSVGTYTGADPDDGTTTNDRLLFSQDASSFASQINFYSGDTTSSGFLGTGGQITFGGAPGFEIVPVPEPSSTALLGAIALLGLVGFRERRRLRRVFSDQHSGAVVPGGSRNQS